jgi:hypothetical protein
MALLARFLWGALNGNIGIAKATLSEGAGGPLTRCPADPNAPAPGLQSATRATRPAGTRQSASARASGALSDPGSAPFSRAQPPRSADAPSRMGHSSCNSTPRSLNRKGLRSADARHVRHPVLAPVPVLAALPRLCFGRGWSSSSAAGGLARIVVNLGCAARCACCRCALCTCTWPKRYAQPGPPAVACHDTATPPPWPSCAAGRQCHEWNRRSQR